MGGKRERERKGRKSKRSGKAAENGSTSASAGPGATDEEYVAYASDGSDAIELAAEGSDSDDAESSDGDIPLAPVKSGEGDEDAMSDVEVSFEFFDPIVADGDTVALLMKDFTRDTKLSPHEVATAIVEQTTVGTMVKITDEPAPVAFVSCLSMRKHRELLSGLLQKLDDAGGTVGEVVRRGTDSEVDDPRNRTGLILTERVVNLPPVLVAKMQEAIFCEIEWATEDEEDESEREAFRFSKFLYVTDAYCQTRGSDSGNDDGPNKRRRKEDSWSYTFPKPEDEAWLSVAQDTVTWPIEGELPGAQGLIRRRVAMIVHTSKIQSLRDKTSRIVGSEADAGEEQGEPQPGQTT